MKSLRKTNSTSPTCSCSSCIYNSDGDRLSLQRLLLGGSRIDRLYYGKYIPLRERKLLDKLVRTRAVYDDIRAQLVSDSTTSLPKYANFKRKSSASELDDTEKSSAILELVNIVDKGTALKSSKLSECCSCCSCSSKMKINEHTHRVHRHRHAHGHRHAIEKRRYEFKKRRGVRFKAKHIKSDPCTCTFQFSGLAEVPPKTGYTYNSEDMDVKVKTDKFKAMAKKSLQNIVDSKTKLTNKMALGMKKVQDSKTKLQEAVALRGNESLERFKRMKYQLKLNKNFPENVAYEEEQWLYEDKTTANRLKNLARSSREKLRISETKLQNKMHAAGEKIEVQVKKSLQKIKEAKNKLKSITCKCPESSENTLQEKELALKIKKDSIRKFKENLNKKQILEDWTCEDDCIEGICIPEQCYKRLMIKRSYKKRMRDKRNRHVQNESNTKVSSREINVNLSHPKSSTGIQAQQIEMQKATKSATKSVKIKKSSKKNKGKDTHEKEKKGKKRKPLPSSSTTSKKGTRQAVRIGSSFSFNIEFYKEKPSHLNNKKSYPIQITNSEDSVLHFSHQGGKKQIVTKGQKETHARTKKSKKDVKLKGYALKRCFCTLKLKPKRRKSISQKSIGTMSSFQSVESKINRKNINSKYQYEGLLPYECEPGTCVPYKCNPYECLKLQNKRLATQKRLRTKSSYTTSSRKTRSTSSVTPIVRSSKAKQVQSAIIPRRMKAKKKDKLIIQGKNTKLRPNRNVVRIGSTFSFNIDFYKEKGQQRPLPKQYNYERKPDIHSFVVQPKIKEKNNVKKVKKVKEKHKRKIIQTSSTGTETAANYNIYKKTRSKASKTENALYNFSYLEPYECEPFTCIPGECDPYICLQNIKKRYKQTREVSLGTIHPESRSTSSYAYSQGRPKNAFAQSKPRTKGRKVLVKAEPARPVVKKILPVSPGSEINKLRNAVSVGSKFSFNIEFSKNYTTKAAYGQVAPLSTPLNIKTKGKVKHKGIKIHKPHVDNVDTQINKVKKVDKSSIVGPMLKRCFCTLNLYKKRKRENGKYNYREIRKNAMYTINTAIIDNTIPSKLSLYGNKKEIIPKNRYDITMSKYLNSQRLVNTKQTELLQKRTLNEISTLHLHPIHSKIFTKQSLEITSDLSVNVGKKDWNNNFYVNNGQVQEGLVIENDNSHLNIKKKYGPIKINKEGTGLSDYFNKCFYAMNMQLENKHRPNRKLKPYECEPGVCIPGQCDPYECQKMILKRLQKAYSKSSGTGSYSKSISSSQTQKTPNMSHAASVSLKPDYKHKQAVRIVQKPGDRKQVVRLGSSFSFDVEFFKNKSHGAAIPKQYNIKPHRRSHERLSMLTKGKQSSKQTKDRKNFTKYDTHESGSQSDRQKVKAKPSQALQGMQRCFCTLKLHKKGKLEQRVKKRVSAATLQSESINVKTVNRGQNTKPTKITHELLPYECEPGICIPGECDPYECLARINKRNLHERGTDAFLPKKRTASIVTSSMLKKRKSRAIYVQPKRRQVVHSQKVKPDIMLPHDNTRQTVRIGSSFSFNIDFYKDNSPSKNSESIMITKKNKTQHRTQVSEVSKPKIHRKNITFSPSQSQISQTLDMPQRTKSTAMKPFLRRCFCTLQLRNKKHKVKREHIKKPQYKSVMTMTKKQFDVRRKVNDSHELLPYECEPGVCIPGECDPLVCFERIKKRNLRSLGTETIYQQRKSIGSTPTRREHRHKKIQFQRYHQDKPKLKAANATVPRYVVGSDQRQTVRIGSNFSFNVEFFKDTGFNSHKISHDDSEIPIKKIKESKRDTKVLPKISKKHKIIQDKIYSHAGHSQTLTNSKSVKSGMISTLERCFCTLALRKDKETNNKKYYKEKEILKKVRKSKESANKDVQTTKSTVSHVSTLIKKCLCILKPNSKKKPQMQPVVNFEIKPQKQKKQNLEPYECEPGVCVPGKCDPYECEKRIKRRLLRESATETKHMEFNTRSSFTPTKLYKSRHVKTKSLKSKPTTETLSPVMPKSKPAISLKNKEKNRQTVRIGSTFSFDVEFFKDRSAANPFETKYLKNIDTRSILAQNVKPKFKTKGHQSKHNVGKYNISQSANVDTQPSSTITDPVLKRCFCTLQFHKSAARLNDRQKVKKKPLQTPKQNKMTSTKNATMVSYMTSPCECPPLMCVPNTCKPYECNEKLKKIKTQSQKVGDHDKEILHKSVEARALSTTKSKKVQAKITEKLPLQPYSQQEKRVVEVPRFTNYLNKENRQAVKFGSNFSLNIEFYRELLPPVNLLKTDLNKADLKEKGFEICDNSNCLSTKNKNIPVLHANAPNNKSQVKKSQTASKKSITANKLKRCLCTLKLQKSKNEQITSKPLFPQVIEVRRVDIQKNNKKSSKKTNTETKNVCTKIDDKLINPKIKERYVAQKNVDKMTTILPYQPTKFNKKSSKTVLKHDNKLNKKQRKKPSVGVSGYGKRLTRKKSQNALYCPKSCSVDKSKKSALKQYLCRCADVFSKTEEPIFSEDVHDNIVKKKQETVKVLLNKNVKKKANKKATLTGDLKTSYSERQSKRSFNDSSKIKRSKSLRPCLCKGDNNHTSNVTTLTNLNGNQLESGDNKLKLPLPVLKKSALKSPNDKTFVCPKCLDIHNTIKEKKKMKVNFKDIPKNLEKKEKLKTMKKETPSNQLPNSTSKTKSKNICKSCSKSIDEKCKYCKVCYKSENQFKQYFDSFWKVVEKLPIKTWIKNFQHKDYTKKETTPKPLFDVYLESDSFSIINKDEVNKKVIQLNKNISKSKTKAKKHGESCRCCICLGKKGGKSNKVIKNRNQKLGKCICGSELCAQKVEEIKNGIKVARDKQSKGLKPCVCGSPICAEESALLQEITKRPGEMVCSCKKEMEIRKQQLQVKNQKAYKKRRKVLSKQEHLEDSIRRKFRRKEDLRLEKSINKNSSDVMLAAESVMDVAKLGITGVTDILRVLYRCVRDPKHTLQTLKSMKEDPSLIGRTLQNAYSDSGVASTARRVKKRVLSMESVQGATQFLEQYPVSNYLLHIADKDPKKRLRKIKKKRQKERFDFHCNLFMSSLRKRPFLFIYDRCPWFYPHCLSIVNVWRQFADLMLFLLAVVVWSPCIFAMEICRAVMCCTLCTG